MSGTNYIENALLDHPVGNATLTGGQIPYCISNSSG